MVVNKVGALDLSLNKIIRLVFVVLFILVLMSFVFDFVPFFSNLGLLSKFSALVLIVMLAYGDMGLLLRTQW